jgi:hypothetical protein
MPPVASLGLGAANVNKCDQWSPNSSNIEARFEGSAAAGDHRLAYSFPSGRVPYVWVWERSGPFVLEVSSSQFDP